MHESSYRVRTWIALVFVGVVGVTSVMLSHSKPASDRVPIVQLTPRADDRPVQPIAKPELKEPLSITDRTRQFVDEIGRKQSQRMFDSMRAREAAAKARRERQTRELREELLKGALIGVPIVILIIALARRVPSLELPPSRPTRHHAPPPRPPPPPPQPLITAKCEHCGTIQDPPDHGRCRHCGGRLGERRATRVRPW